MAETADLDALVTRNIGDIEAALAHARELGHSLIEQIEAILIDGLGEEWHVWSDTEEDPPLWLSHRSWLDEGKPSRKNAYRLELNEHEGLGGDYDESWFATMMAAGPNGATIRVNFQSSTFGTDKRWKRLVEGQEKLVEKLLDAGFETTEKGRLYIPFSLNSELLAQGYEAGSLDHALQPARDLAVTVGRSASTLSAFVERDRNLD